MQCLIVLSALVGLAAASAASTIENIACPGKSVSDSKLHFNNVQIQFLDCNKKPSKGPTIPGYVKVLAGKMTDQLAPLDSTPWNVQITAEKHEFFAYVNVCDLDPALCKTPFNPLISKLFGGPGAIRYIDSTKNVDVTELPNTLVPLATIKSSAIMDIIEGEWKVSLCVYQGAAGASQCLGCFGFMSQALNVKKCH